MLEHLGQALDLAERIDSASEQSWLLSGLATALQLDGDRARAVVYARRALELAQRQGRAYDRDQARGILDGLGAASL